MTTWRPPKVIRGPTSPSRVWKNGSMPSCSASSHCSTRGSDSLANRSAVPGAAVGSVTGLPSRCGPVAQGLEPPLPRLVAAAGVADIGRQADGPDQAPVDLVDRRPQRPDDVGEKDDPHALGVIPGLVVVAVVEEQALAFLPVGHLVVDPDAGRRR